MIDDIKVPCNRVLALHVLHLFEFACLLSNLHIQDAGQGLFKTRHQVKGISLGTKGGYQGLNWQE